MTEATSVDEYLASLPDHRRAAMTELRAAVLAGAPEAMETIAYGMPALRSHGGQFLVSYDAYKSHYSLFPASDEVVRQLGAEVTPYVAGKGTFRFPAHRAIPADLVTRIVRIRYGEISARKRR